MAVQLGGGGARVHGAWRRRAVAIALALALDLVVSARTDVARASDGARASSEVALEMMPDDALSPADARALAQLRDAIEAVGRDPAASAAGRRTIEGMSHRHRRLLLRWLLGDGRRVALGYARAAVLDVLISSLDARAQALGTEALLARPGLGYCMRALPPETRAGRLAGVVRDLRIVEALRREAARLLLTVGEPAEAARTQGEARARVERIAVDQLRVVRRWLLDESDAGMLDTYRAEIVNTFLASTTPPLRALATEIALRRARLAPSPLPAAPTATLALMPPRSPPG